MRNNVAFSGIRAVAHWVLRNLGIPISLALLGVVYGAYDQLHEVSAWDYTALADNWDKLTPATRKAVASLMDSSGKITRWDYQPEIFDALLKDTGGYAVSPVDYPLQSARERLITKIRDSHLD
jgi:hypothetical protein